MTLANQPARPAASRGWIIARLGCLLIMVGVLAPFAASLPLRARQLAGTAEPLSILGLPPELEAAYTSRLGPAETEALRLLGLSPGLYAAYVLTFEAGLALVGALIGLFILWRSPQGWLALWTATVLALLGTGTAAPELPTLSTRWPGWWSVFIVVGMLGMVSNLHLLFLAPDGRFVPRWTGRLAAGFSGAMLALAVFTFTAAQDWGPLGSLVGILLAAPAWLALLALGGLCQWYRYRRVSGPVERQQTKWVAVGLACVTVGIALNAALLNTAGLVNGLPRVWLFLARATLVYPFLAGLPICLAFSILRYRLWDIDVIIRRTLVYASLTAALVAIYFGCVVVLQAVVGGLAGGEPPALVTVLSTLAIAALFGPLRSRVQRGIDRRFFRRKYDAARVLASFGASLRDETDLARLSERLVGVVDQTMQPASASLWLRPPRGQITHPRLPPTADW
jgi:hypothetical protein